MATSDDVRINIIAETKNAIAGMAKFAAGIGAAILVAKKLIQVGADMIKAYGEDEQAQARLATAIKTTGHEADINQKALSRLASQLQRVTTYGDEATITAMAMLQQLANLNQKGLEQVTPAMLDFAAAMGVDLQTAASLIGKTLGSSTNALSRYGIEIDATAGPTDKLNQLTAALNEKFKGTAEALGETTLGRMEQYKNALGDLKEQGGKLLTTVFNPLVMATADFVTNLNDIIAKREALAGKSGEGELLQAQADDAFRAYSRAWAEMDKLQKAIDKMDAAQRQSWLGQGQVERLNAMKDQVKELSDAWYAADVAVVKFNEESEKAAKATTTTQIKEQAEAVDDMADSYGELAKVGNGFMGLLPDFNIEMSISNKMYDANAAYIQEATDSMNAYYNMLIKTNEALVEYAEDVEVARIESGEMIELLKAQGELAASTEQAYKDLATNGLMAIGEALVDMEGGIESFKDVFKSAITTMLKALSEYLVTMALASIANPALAVAYGAGAAAALIAAGTVQALAGGGVVTKPTLALIGEAGPEAVVPLGSGGGMGSTMVVNVYGNLLTERQLVDGILRRAAGHARSY